MASQLAELADVKAWLKIDYPDDDLLLQRLIGAAGGFLESWLNRTIAATDYVESYSGNGKPFLILRNIPVLSVGAVTVDGLVIPQKTDRSVTGWISSPTSVSLVGYTFHRGLLNVGVSYRAGYETIPPEIAQACIELAALRYSERDRIGEQTKLVGGESVTYSLRDMPASVQTLLGTYKRVVMP